MKWTCVLSYDVLIWIKGSDVVVFVLVVDFECLILVLFVYDFIEIDEVHIEEG